MPHLLSRRRRRRPIEVIAARWTYDEGLFVRAKASTCDGRRSSIAPRSPLPTTPLCRRNPYRCAIHGEARPVGPPVPPPRKIRLENVLRGKPSWPQNQSPALEAANTTQNAKRPSAKCQTHGAAMESGADPGPPRRRQLTARDRFLKVGDTHHGINRFPPHSQKADSS